MLLKQRSNGHLVEVVKVQDLFNVMLPHIVACDQVGEEMQDPESFSKGELIFPSGEELPRCWTDPHFRDREWQR